MACPKRQAWLQGPIIRPQGLMGRVGIEAAVLEQLYSHSQSLAENNSVALPEFELHHIEEVAQGGAVYDLDNLVVLTPKQHIDIHKR